MKKNIIISFLNIFLLISILIVNNYSSMHNYEYHSGFIHDNESNEHSSVDCIINSYNVNGLNKDFISLIIILLIKTLLLIPFIIIINTYNHNNFNRQRAPPYYLY